MTRPMFRAEPARLAQAQVGAELTLEGAEAHHAAVVRRVRPGEQLLVGDGLGRVATGTVTQVAPTAVTVCVSQVHHEPPSPLRLVLVQALAKGGRDEAAIEAATELGVDEIIPWQAHRCIVQWSGPKMQRAQAKWQSLVQAAAKQSRRAHDPLVAPLATTQELATRLRQPDTHSYLLHEAASTKLAGEPLPSAGSLLLIVGPEGGIDEQEGSWLQDAGARPVRLGPNVLRSSTAGPAALTLVLAQRQWRG